MPKRAMSVHRETFFTTVKNILISWAPVFCFVTFCFSAYLHAHKKKAVCFEQLKTRFEELTVQKQQAISIRDDLKLQIESQSDPLWIEQTLMRGLGLVPEGQKKILFKEREADLIDRTIAD